MPWSPPWSSIPDPRLDPYRDCVAALERHGVLVGHLLVLAEPFSTQVGGWLWWRRWSTQELPMLFIELTNGDSIDHYVIEDAELTDELDHWSRDEFPLLGEVLTMRWLRQDEAIRTAPDVFGVTWCLDNYDQVIWSWPDDK